MKRRSLFRICHTKALSFSKDCHSERLGWKPPHLCGESWTSSPAVGAGQVRSWALALEEVSNLLPLSLGPTLVRQPRPAAHLPITYHEKLPASYRISRSTRR